MILGLTLLTANLRAPIETLMVYLFLFWERKSMIALLRKNLMAHKATNKLTSIIYALTLGCVIFLCVSLNLVIDSVQSIIGMPGADIYVSFAANFYSSNNMMSPFELDPILKAYSDKIEDFALMTASSYAASNFDWKSYSSDVTTKQH